MREVSTRLWVGDALDWENLVDHQPQWGIIHAAKEPWHRAALGYTTRGAPIEHPSYLFHWRGNTLSLNLVDAGNLGFIPSAVIDEALGAITAWLGAGLNVLVHCNQGESRAPAIALLFLVRMGALQPDTAVEEFRSLYPPYKPGPGMRDYVQRALDQSPRATDSP